MLLFTHYAIKARGYPLSEPTVSLRYMRSPLACGKTPTTVVSTSSEHVKSNSRTICTQISQLASADRQSSGHEWTANPSLHDTRTV